MTDKELEKIYNEAYRAVYWTAMSLLKNEADAEDIVQDTFVTLIESYDTLNDKDKVIPWLKKIAANKCLNRLARTKTDAVEDEFFDDVEAIAEDFLPDSIVESEEARKIVMDIINNKLSDDIRRTLILFYFDDMSTKEIAEALDVPEGTVRRRLNFARNKIKKEVEKYEEENDTKLFGMAIPFLTKLFVKETEQVAIKPMPASLANLSASAEASSKGVNIKASTEAIKKGTDIMKTKILIGSIAAVVAVGATIGIIAGVVSKNKKDSFYMCMDGMSVDECVENIWKTGNVRVGMTKDEYYKNMIAPEDNPPFTTENSFSWTFQGGDFYFGSIQVFSGFSCPTVFEGGDYSTVKLQLHYYGEDAEFADKLVDKLIKKYISEGFTLEDDNQGADGDRLVHIGGSDHSVSIVRSGSLIVLEIPLARK